MKQQLANVLIDRDILKFESKILAYVRSLGLGGDPVTVKKELVLTKVTKEGCLGYNTRDPETFYPVKYSDVIRFEGMTLSRLAEAYELNVDGSKRKTGKKPGRKPKEKV